MAVKFTYKVRGDPVPAINREIRAIAERDTRRRAENTLGAARANLRARSRSGSGEVGRTLGYSLAETVQGWAARVGSDDERARWVEEGTGLYGPHRSPIRPKAKKWMRFVSGRGAVVFTQQTAGQPGKHFLRDAAEAALD